MSYSNGPKIVTSGLVLHLDAASSKSYPGSGTTWNDLSGNNNNGTLTNGPIYSTLNRGCIVFDGSNDYININSTLANSILSALTYNIWIKPNAVAGMGLCVNFNSATSQSGFDFRLTSSSIDIIYFSNGANYIGRRASILYSSNIWYNITATWNGAVNNNGFSIYLYGNRADDTNVSGGTVSSITNGGASLEMGRERFASGPTNYLNGSIGNFSIYNRVLLSSEILQNFNCTRGRYGL